MSTSGTMNAAAVVCGLLAAGAASADVIQYVGQERTVHAWAYAESFEGWDDGEDDDAASGFAGYERTISIEARMGLDAFARVESVQLSQMDDEGIRGSLSVNGWSDAFNFGYTAGESDADFAVRFRLEEPKRVVLASQLAVAETFEESEEGYGAQVALRDADGDVLWTHELAQSGNSGRMAYEAWLAPGEYELMAHATLEFESGWENQSAEVHTDFSMTFVPAPSALAPLLLLLGRPRRR